MKKTKKSCPCGKWIPVKRKSYENFGCVIVGGIMTIFFFGFFMNSWEEKGFMALIIGGFTLVFAFFIHWAVTEEITVGHKWVKK